jgi:outer membrane protein assembly factor BamB
MTETVDALNVQPHQASHGLSRVFNVVSGRAIFRSFVPLLGLLLLAGLWSKTLRPSNGTFTELATVRGLGHTSAMIVGPGPTVGSERYYVSYSYDRGTAEIVSIDPATGQYKVFTPPDKRITVVWSLSVGPDGKIYAATRDEARLLCIDPKAGTIVDLGRTSETESNLWQLVWGSDHKLYGCTYPSAKLVRYDPATKKMEDLGRMDPVEQYARFIAAGRDGFIYLGIGFAKNRLVAYEISSGQHRDILPEEFHDPPYGVGVQQDAKGNVFGQVVKKGVTGPVQTFRLEGWNAIPIPKNQAAGLAPYNLLKDGRTITRVSDGTIDIQEPVTKAVAKAPYLYKGSELAIFRLGLGPDGMVYGSTAMPARLYRVNTATGQLTDVSGVEPLGTGEVYSFLASKSVLLIAAYASSAPLMAYITDKPYNPGAKESPNPYSITLPDSRKDWRPMAMSAGRDGNVYIGSMPGYGQLGGKLTVFDPAAHTIKGMNEVIKDQSVTSLASWDKYIVGGTAVGGGGGSVASTKEAKLFLWDTTQQSKVYETVPVPDAENITDLITAPNGLIFGIAGPLAREDQLFVFDPVKREIVYRAKLPSPVVINSGVYNSIAVGPDGRLFGLFPTGVFSIDPKSYRVQVEALYVGSRITAGFALTGRDIYFAAGSRVVRYTMN